MNYIDAHAHIWTDDTETFPLGPGHTKESMKPPAFPPDELLSHARPCGVDRVVLVQMSYYGPDNTYMLKAMRDYEGVFAGIGVVDPQGENPDGEMRRLAGEGVRGFRIVPRSDPMTDCLDGEAFERMFRAGADERLALCPLIATDALPALSRRCEQFPGTPVIIDHLCLIAGGPPIAAAEVEALCGMAQYPNVMVKVSAFYALGEKKPPYLDMVDPIRRVCEAFGADRLMWASDSPYQVQNEHTYEASVALIRDHLDFLSVEDRDQILRGTAEAFFFSK